MEVKPIHIVMASVFAFCAIVAANMLSQYQSNEAFREQWSKISPQKLLAARKQLIAEEQMVPASEDIEED